MLASRKMLLPENLWINFIMTRQAFKCIELLLLCTICYIAFNEPLRRNYATAGPKCNIHLHELRFALALFISVVDLNLGHTGAGFYLRHCGELVCAVIMFAERVDIWCALDVRRSLNEESMRLTLREFHLGSCELWAQLALEHYIGKMLHGSNLNIIAVECLSEASPAWEWLRLAHWVWNEN